LRKKFSRFFVLSTIKRRSEITKNITLNDHIIAHCNESISIALSVERHPLWARSCPEMSDINFTYCGLLRCIDNVDSGRHFLQKTEDIHDEKIPLSTNPGTIAMLYFKRWTIEKAFNNSKRNLKETKAWSSDFNALKNQMRLTLMTYNLMRVLEEVSKTQDPELTHPSDKKYTKALEKRDQAAKKTDCFFNPLFFQSRIVRISSYTIRAVQNAIVTGKFLVWVMNALIA